MCSGGVDELCAENSHLCAQLEALQAEPVSHALHARSHRVRLALTESGRTRESCAPRSLSASHARSHRVRQNP